MAPASANAVLPVDKPAGPTSHDVVAGARRALGIRRIGHTGTLDPFATGLLLLCTGHATRLAEYLTGLTKSYEATLRLGVTTATDDGTGDVVATSDAWRAVTAADVEAALRAQTGRLLQTPPAYSAKKIEGERAYRRARRGEAPVLAPAAVEVYTLEVTRVEPPEADFRVSCSAGTYIRSIARDAGEALGTGAHLSCLRRTAIGAFRVEHALSLDRLADPAAVEAACMTPLDALRHLPHFDLDAGEAVAIRHGRTVRRPDAADADTAALAADGVLVAVASVAGGTVRPRKVFGGD